MDDITRYKYGLSSVSLDDLHDAVVSNLEWILFKAIVFDCFLEKMALANLELLKWGVARNLDDFHTIAQWTRYSTQVIGSHYKDDLR